MVKGNLVKETKEGYYYNNFLKDGWYIIRWLLSGGYHLYPYYNGELPEGFTSKEEAEEYIRKWWSLEGDTKVVNGIEACNYPVPKRW